MDTGYCQCGTQVWAGGKPRLLELVICPSCGRDCSLKVSFWYRVRHARYYFRKHRHIYGWRAALTEAKRRKWWWRLDREIEYDNLKAQGRHISKETDIAPGGPLPSQDSDVLPAVERGSA